MIYRIMLDKRTIEILAQVVYKELEANNRSSGSNDGIGTYGEFFWKKHYEQTLELARNIYKLDKEINKPNSVPTGTPFGTI